MEDRGNVTTTNLLANLDISGVINFVCFTFVSEINCKGTTTTTTTTYSEP